MPSHPYKALADDIAAKVQRGDLKAGEQLPSIRALAKEYGITTATVQKGLKQLTDDGYVTSVPGLGIFVSEAPEEGTEAPVTIQTVVEQLDALQAAMADLAQRVKHLENRDAR
ncbi:regulatory protein, gntR family [Allokutzneria albata]|uniref:Regulatory protein, gntR family n=2 Tax=Allokutzneria albata TaxID=211114 RepID=A0A1H0CBR0_ALLAB|nr:regulatory protein, gntR family [Allokutzneria albata]